MNNFTTMRFFADYHNIPLETAEHLIALGRNINNNQLLK